MLVIGDQFHLVPSIKLLQGDWPPPDQLTAFPDFHT